MFDAAPDEAVDVFRKSVRDFISREVAPNFEEWEDGGLIDKNLFLRAGDAGLLGLSAPVEFGGGGNTDFRFNAVIIEEFCRGGVLSAGQGIILHADIVLPYFVQLCNEEQRARWLPGLCSGGLVGAIAMTEPSTGSDLASITTKATRNGDHYVLNGAKQFITNGANADLIVVVSKTGESSARHRNISLLVVESAMQGFTRGRILKKIGQHAVDTAELSFSDVQIPPENLLGAENEGFRYLVSNLPQERLTIALTAVAHAEAAFGWTLEYCKQREAFGQPIGSFQANRFTLATMRTELDIAQVFLERQVEALSDGSLTPEQAAEAKWWCTDLNSRVLDRCLQLHGGYGYMEEYPIARAWRDGRAMAVYGGTNEIMKEIIGRRMLGI